MTSPNQLLDLANQGKLDEIDTLAALAHGWVIEPVGSDDFIRYFWLDKATDKLMEMENQYHPTRDKAQAWDLMVKGGLTREYEWYDLIGYHWGRVVENPEPRVCEYHLEQDIVLEPTVAVTIAFILAMQGEE